MKIIKYQICTRVNHGSKEKPVWKDTLYPVKIECTADKLEGNIAIAIREAYNGEYTIQDDGKQEPDTSTTNDVLNALLGVTV